MFFIRHRLHSSLSQLLIDLLEPLRAFGYANLRFSSPRIATDKTCPGNTSDQDSDREPEPPTKAVDKTAVRHGKRDAPTTAPADSGVAGRGRGRGRGGGFSGSEAGKNCTTKIQMNSVADIEKRSAIEPLEETLTAIKPLVKARKATLTDLVVSVGLGFDVQVAALEDLDVVETVIAAPTEREYRAIADHIENRS